MYNCTELQAAKGPQTELALDRTTQQKKSVYLRPIACRPKIPPLLSSVENTLSSKIFSKSAGVHKIVFVAVRNTRFHCFGTDYLKGYTRGDLYETG